MRVIVLVGGHGTRLKPLTDTMPKAMIPIEGKPVIGYVLDWLDGVNLNRIDIPIGEHCNQIREYADASYDLPIRWVDEDEPRGTASAVMQCLEDVEEFSITEPVLVINGDMILVGHNSRKFKQAIRWYAMPMFSVDMSDTPEKYGVVGVDLEMRIKSIVEKPDPPMCDYYLSGYYHFPSAYRLKFVYNGVVTMALGDSPIKAFPVKTLDCGSHEGLKQAQAYLITEQNRWQKQRIADRYETLERMNKV